MAPIINQSIGQQFKRKSFLLLQVRFMVKIILRADSLKQQGHCVLGVGVGQCAQATFFFVDFYRVYIGILIFNYKRQLRIMSNNNVEMKFDSPIAVPESILQEEEGFTTPKLAPKKKQAEKRQIEAIELAHKRIFEKQEDQFDDSKLIFKKIREQKKRQVDDSKLTLKKTQVKKRQFDDIKLTQKKQKNKLDAPKQALKKVPKMQQSQSPLLIEFEHSQPQEKTNSDPKEKHEISLYCHQKNMEKLRMKAKSLIRQRSKAQKREQLLRNLPVGQAIKSEVQVDPQMSQESQNIIVTEEQPKKYQEIQDSFQAMREKLYPKNYSLQEIIKNLPRLMKGYRVVYKQMRRTTVLATKYMMISNVLKSQMQKELTQADKKTYEKVLSDLDKYYEEVDQGIEKIFPGEKESIYKRVLPKKLYQIYRKNKQEKMSFKQKQASVHILKMQ